MARVVLRGRAPELARALDTLRRTQRTGRAAVLMVSGPAGIGRSAYVNAVAVEAAALGFRVGAGGTGPAESTISGAPLLVALRSGPDPLLDHDAFMSLAPLYDREVWLVDRICDLLGDLAADVPLLLVVDDVHGADPLTRFALRNLPARLSTRPVVWVLASRSGATEIADDIALAAGTCTAVTRVTLGPLEAADVDAIARDHLGRPPSDGVRDLVRAAGGVPAWVARLLQGVDDRADPGVPDFDVQAELLRSTRRRLSVLPALAVDLVRLAAVWDRPLAVSTAVALIAGPSAVQVADAAHDACADGLLDRRGELLALPHHWVREVVYGDLETTERRRLHLLCAQHLLAVGDRLTAAGHLRAGAAVGDVEAARSLLSAADDQQAVAPTDAAGLARSAWALVAGDGSGHPDIAARAVDLLHATGRDLDAVSVVDAVLADLEPDPLTDPTALARWRGSAVSSLVAASAWDAARTRLDDALGDLAAGADTRAPFEAARAVVQAMTSARSTLSGTGATGSALLAAAQQRGDPLTEHLAVTALVVGHRREARHRAAWHVLSRPELSALPSLTVERIRTLQDLDQHAAAAAELETVGAGAACAPAAVRQLPGVLVLAARQDLDLGRLDDAKVRARALAAIARDTRNAVHRTAAAALSAEVAINRGEPVDLTDAPDHTVVEWSSGVRVLQAATLARADDVGSALRLVLPVAAAYGAGYCATMWSPSWTRLLLGIALAADDRRLAGQVVKVAEGVASCNTGVPSWVGSA